MTPKDEWTCQGGGNDVLWCQCCQPVSTTEIPLAQPAAVPVGPVNSEPPISEAEWRKQRPLWSGVMRYFPDALLEVAHVSWVGNDQHNPGEPLHWDRAKSTDEGDACARHLAAAGTRDSDGTRHAAKAAWRALALLQKEIEAERKEGSN